MKKSFLYKMNILFVVFILCFLQGCETLKGFSGKDRGPVKISQGVGKDFQNTWNKIIAADAVLREKLW